MVRLRIKEVAQEKGISMNKLARLTDLNIGTMRKLWRNDDPNYDPSLSTLQKVADVLAVPLQELLMDTSDTASSTKEDG